MRLSKLAAALVALTLAGGSSAAWAQPPSPRCGATDWMRGGRVAGQQAEPVDLRAAALGLVERQAPRLARYATGAVQLLPLFARDTVGVSLSVRLP